MSNYGNDSIVKSCAYAFLQTLASSAGLFTGLVVAGTVLDFVKKRQNKKSTPDES